MLCGATPVFVDMRRDTFNMDVESLEAAIGEAKRRGLKPRCVIPVDLYGQPADYKAIDEIAEAHDLFVIGRRGAELRREPRLGEKVGTLAAYTATSFYPSKPLGGYGDGGAVFTDDDDKARAPARAAQPRQGARPAGHRICRPQQPARIRSRPRSCLRSFACSPAEIPARQERADRYNEGLAAVVKVPRADAGRDVGLGAIHHRHRGSRRVSPRPAARPAFPPRSIMRAALNCLPPYRRDAHAAGRASSGGMAGRARDQPADASLSHRRGAGPRSSPRCARRSPRARQASPMRPSRAGPVEWPWQIQFASRWLGSGYFGRFHADHYARNPRAQLVAVVDTDADARPRRRQGIRRRARIRLSQHHRPGRCGRASPCRRRSITTSRAS